MEKRSQTNIIIISLVVIIVLLLGVALLFYSKGKDVCGDNKCSDEEKMKGTCSKDCKDIMGTEKCWKLGGDICLSSETCSGEWISASDTSKCCEVTCTSGNNPNIIKKCGKLGGDVCLSSETCSGEWISASDTNRCCNVNCVIENSGPIDNEADDNDSLIDNGAGIYEDSPLGITPAFTSINPSDPYYDAHYIGVKWDERIGNPMWACIQPDLTERKYYFKGCDIEKFVDYNLDEDMTKTPLDIGIVPMFEGWVILENSPGERFNENSWEPKEQFKDDYQEFVRKTIERYDGDSDLGCDIPAPDCYVTGDNQYPSQQVISHLQQRQIKYWKLSTEPNLFVGSLTGYDNLLQLTYTAMKEADSNTKLVSGGIPGHPYCYLGHCSGASTSFPTAFDSPNQYETLLQNLEDDCADFCDSFNGECNNNCLDIFSIHWYFAGLGDYKVFDTATNENILTYIRQKLDENGFSGIPIWISNTDTYSGNPDDNPLYDIVSRTETQQAADIVKIYVYPLSRGIPKIIMEMFMEIHGDSFKVDCPYFDLAGIIYDGQRTDCGDLGLGVKKLGYYTYKLMTDKLEGSDWSDVEEIYNSDNVYAYRFIKDNAPIYVIWWDYWNEPSLQTKTINIPLDIDGTVKITKAIPSFENGLILQNSGESYAEMFDTENEEIVGGQLSVTLDEAPVYVEEM